MPSSTGHTMVCDETTALVDDKVDWVNRHVCRRLKSGRIVKGLSQETLARAMGISYQQLQRYESAKSRLPSSLMYRAALRLEVPVGYFFDDMPDDVVAPLQPRAKAPEFDKPALAAVRNIEGIVNPETRQSLLRLIDELSRPADRSDRFG